MGADRLGLPGRHQGALGERGLQEVLGERGFEAAIEPQALACPIVVGRDRSAMFIEVVQDQLRLVLGVERDRRQALGDQGVARRALLAHLGVEEVV